MSVAYAYPPQMGGGVPAAMDGYGSMQGSFAFKKRFERIDWKKIASADIDSISRNLDFNALQDNIMNITFCNIESEVDTRQMDPNFLKLFKLAQLTIEYLLHSQDYLSSMVGNLEEKLKKSFQEHEETKKQMEKTQSDLAEVKKECHKRKKMLVAQQQILQDGANAYNKCLYCSKAFINPTFLQSHMARRHPEHGNGQRVDVVLQPQNMVPLAESQGQVNQEKAEQLEKSLAEMKEMLSKTEQQLTQERNARNKNQRLEREHEEEARLREQAAMLERLRAEQKQQHKEEMKTMEDLFTKKLNEMNTKYKSQTATVEGLQSKLNARSAGRWDEEVQHEKEELRKQREDVAMLKENLQDQVKKMEKQLNHKMVEKEKKWQEDMTVMQKKHQMQIEELNEALEQSALDTDKEDVQNHYEQTLKEATFVLEHTLEREQSHKEQGQPPRHQPDAVQNTNQNKPQSIKDQVEKATTAAPTGQGRMEPPSDDDTTEMLEATTTMGTGGPSTLRTLQGTGSLSLNATRQAQLMEAIKKNPDFLRGMRQQLKGVFEDMLEKRGVPKNAVGMSSMDYSNKAGILKKERQQKAQSLPNYWEIRQQYINEVDHLARQRMQQQRKTTGPPLTPSLSSSAPLTSGKPRPQSATASPNKGGGPVQRSQSAGQARGVPRQPPVASPRGTLQSTKSTNRQSLDSQGDDETMTSTQWSDSDSEEESETEESEGIDEVDNGRTSSAAHQTPARQGTAAAQRQPAQRQPPTSSAARTASSGSRGGSSQLPQRKVQEDSDEDGSWNEDISELNDILDPETPRPKPSSSKPQIRSTSTPKGENVSRLSQSIEEQLQGRGGKKPAGGINTVTSQKQPGQHSDDDDEVSLESVSDIDSPRASSAKPRQIATRSSTRTNNSTDTYGSSAWGTGSKAASTVHGGGGAGHERTSVNKSVSKASTSGDVSVSDWDSDDDMDIKDL